MGKEKDDVLAIEPVKEGETITYMFSFDGKDVGSFTTSNETEAAPLIKTGHYSPKNEGGKTEEDNEKAAQAADTKFGTFTIPVEAGRDSHVNQHKYRLLFIPGKNSPNCQGFLFRWTMMGQR